MNITREENEPWSPSFNARTDEAVNGLDDWRRMMDEEDAEEAEANLDAERRIADDMLIYGFWIWISVCGNEIVRMGF